MSVIKDYPDTPIPWRVETVCTLRKGRRVFQLQLRDDANRIACFGFGKNPTSAYLRLSSHAQGGYTPAYDWRTRNLVTLPVLTAGELPHALLALERYLEKK